MERKVSSDSRFRPSLFAVAAVALAIAFSFIATTQARMIETSAGSQTNSSSTRGNLVVLSTDLREKTIRFGDELVVLVSLQNQGTKPIKIPPVALLLSNKRWSQGSGSGSGLGESPLIREGADSKEEFSLQPGESVALTASSIELGTHSMGPMTADFVMETEDKDLRREIGKPERFTVSYYVAPSKLMTSAWAAKTPEERKRLHPPIKDLLILASKPEEAPGSYVPKTLEYLGCHALSFLEYALADSDPVVREQAVRALDRAPAIPMALNSLLDRLNEHDEGRPFAAAVERCNANLRMNERECIKLMITALNDQDVRVRIAAISVLTHRAAYESSLRRTIENNPRARESMDEQAKQLYDSIGLVDPALPLIKKMAGDTDSRVRAEAQKFLSNFASQQTIAAGVIAALADTDAGVRNQALETLKTSREPFPVTTIQKAFASTKGDVALGLIELIYEREDSDLAATLTPGFKERSPAERLMILTTIAGHSDDAALNLVLLGLKDGDRAVSRAALLRLLAFPSEKAISQIKANSVNVASDDIAVAVEKELRGRALFPFLTRAGSVAENAFPSAQGTGPIVSPDGKWVAYVETGWGRPGGSGGFGRSNLLSLTHIARSDGSLDRIVSDMFLDGWMSDSSRVGSARDGYAAIVDLNGKPVIEFGDALDKPTNGSTPLAEGSPLLGKWPTGELRHQIGIRMPHSKVIRSGNDRNSMISFDYGEDAAFSPDGKWFGPRRVKDQWQFVDAEGKKIEFKAPDTWGCKAIWSPDGAHVVVVPAQPSGSFGGSVAVEPSKAYVIDFVGQMLKATIEVDQVWGMGEWSYRKGRWNPWSKDGKRLAFVRRGQIWISDPDGNATQATSDSSNKIFPTFSPDGTKVAYITWQFDNREHYPRLGPTDIWVLDIRSGLAARVTRPDSGRIEGLDWLDNGTIIFDRLEPGWHSSLRTISLR